MPLPRRLKRSRRQEKSTAADLGGKVQPGSGNIRNAYLKEDVISSDFLVQAKTTEASSYRITKKEFEQTEKRALFLLRSPLWRVTIQDELDLAIIRWSDLQQILLDINNAKNT
jgi:hypothetical protein